MSYNPAGLNRRDHNYPLKMKHWYQSWFDTSYYHILYKHRNDEEAAFFLDNVITYLDVSKSAVVWDMACGKGRHVNYLASKKVRAMGTDISVNSIDEARKIAASNAEFFVHDMRNPVRTNYFDVVMNVFTSMGYFTTKRDDERVFLSACQACKKGGYFVVDFMNAVKAERGLVKEEVKTEGGIDFNISRSFVEGVFVKKISFAADGSDYEFEERVRGWRIEDMMEMAATAGFELERVCGDYSLDRFDEENSDRLILIFKK